MTKSVKAMAGIILKQKNSTAKAPIKFIGAIGRSNNVTTQKYCSIKMQYFKKEKKIN